MDGIQDFLAGWFGGVAGLIIGHPADTIKVRQQFMNTKVLTTIKSTFKYEGFFGFYKGFAAPFFTIGLSNAVFFSGYGACLRHLQEQQNGGRVDINDPHWVRNVAIAGCVAGFGQVMVTCPVELIKTVLQINTGGRGGGKQESQPGRYNNTLDAVRIIFKERSIRGFYRGLAPMFWRDVPTSGIYMVMYEILLPRGDHPPVWKQVSAGGCAGIASWMFTVPFDVMKTRMQSDNPNNPMYKGMIDCFHKSYKSGGPGIFWKGFWLIMARAFPVNAAILFGYESILQILQKLPT